MTEEDNICPYTGLRPFTEDESLYFKGRDEHIDQATKQLEKNKFIMLTGASGDGKSSLVYAGIIPNAKAGFLKSQFTNWAVADFRPERNPLENLCHALAGQLNIANENIVRTELSHGFSALVDMYKASALYTNTNDEEWNALDDQQKLKLKRSAANLIIIADQFEEFFTNPENFQKGVPSQEASLVTNLLLETARIALEEKLPIYVIITMRSDFIGQCASFRGLPEAIGFSQFFVPRLNRSQLQEVIEEPALLSGNRISRRLTERLIHDMVEGTDQLPILQHALNQIWKMADSGKAEMDLLHYAMVGGMMGTELPTNDSKQFDQWFANLPSKIRACYNQPNLHNVLNTHANKLYNFSTDYFKDQGQLVSETEAQEIIQVAFKCLTKIDNSRAVRNRMTLAQITAIINQPQLDFKKVAAVLNLFRESGNTLLRPFMEDAVELQESSILDITHESLIRNWGNLAQWAKEEFTNYTTFQDFGQQLNRWVDSDKSGSFLLYIGPLTYFESWFNRVKPNAEWIARYLSEELDHQQRNEKSKIILANAHEFLKRSARKHAATRAVMKYGPKKIAAVLGLITIVALSSFAFKTYLDRRNPAMLESIREQSIPLLNNSKLYFADKAALASEQVRLNLTTVPEVINSIEDPIQKIELANGLAVGFIFQGQREPAKEIAQALSITDSLLSASDIDFTNGKQVTAYLKNVNEWRATLGLAYFYNSTEYLLALQKKNAARSANAVLAMLKNSPQGFTDLIHFSLALETALNFNGFTKPELATVIKALSPFESDTRSEWVTEHFKRDQILTRGYQGYGFNFNGLYQNLACLYAAEGYVDKSLQAIDTLLKYGDPYYQRDYATMLDNATNVASTFYRNQQADKLDEFVNGYCARKKIAAIEFYQRLLGRAKPYNLTRNSSYQTFWAEAHNLNLQYGEANEMEFWHEKFRETLSRSTNADERNFQLAIAYKHEGITIAHKAEVARQRYDSVKVRTLYTTSLKLYEQVSSAYLNETIERILSSNTDLVSAPRKSLYLYPDYVLQFVPLGARDFHWNYMSASFLEYLIDENIFNKLYNNPQELKLFETWLYDYHVHAVAGDIFMRAPVALSFLQKLEKELATLQADSKVDLNLLYLYLGAYSLQANDQSLALSYYSKLKVENFANILNNKILTGYTNSTSFKLIATAYASFVQNNKPEQATTILDFFKKPANRSSLLAFAGWQFSMRGNDAASVKALLDSATNEMNRVENRNSEQPNRYRIAVGLITVEPTDQSVEKANGIIKNLAQKFIILQRMSRTLAYQEELFKATQLIPGNISDTDQLIFLWNTLQGYADKQPMAKEWKEYEDTYTWFDKPDFIPYVNESN